jgi:biopolymer transport protein ExbD
MRRRIVPRPELITRVNVTPIIDVALVLVIILLVTAPMMSVSDLPVDLPQARTREAEDERNLSITIAASGQLAVDEDAIGPEALKPMLERRLSEPGNQEILVVVRADTSTAFSVIRNTLEVARSAGAQRIAIATRQSPEPTR